MKRNLSKFFREPAVIFILLGFVFYMVYSLIAGYLDKSEKEIAISKAQVELAYQNFQKTWNRPPTEAEKEKQIDNLIRNEIFFREAVAMGLDKSDPAVKGRLRQMVEIMMDDFAAVYPSEDQLRKYLNENHEKFQEDPRISFRHVYFPLEQKEEAEKQLTRLNNDLPFDKSKVGSLSLIRETFNDEPKFIVARDFGKKFTDELFALETESWQGPVNSPYGWHLIYISKLEAGIVPELDKIWDKVEREWSFEQTAVKKEEQYQKMKSEYVVKIGDEK